MMSEVVGCKDTEELAKSDKEQEKGIVRGGHAAIVSALFGQ